MSLQSSEFETIADKNIVNNAIEKLKLRSPLVAVVLPVFKQAKLLAEALDSVLTQKADFGIVAILVNDGCPFEETHTTCSDFALAFPERVIYLKKVNGGLSSARNTGIDFVIEKMPSVEAIFFLDSDNRLQTTALNRALMELRQHPEIAWIYPDIDMFGLRDACDYSGEYSVARHLSENICEAGSLVHRRVFEAKVRYDESMKSGYEDWEFWLSAADKGFRGRCLPEFGFCYRRRPESMVAGSRREDEAIRAYMRRKHKAAFEVRYLLHEEHETAPRYVVYLRDVDRYVCFTDPALPGDQFNFQDIEVMLWRGLSEPARTRVPGYLVATTTGFLAFLQKTRLVHWAFWHLEGRLGESDVAALECRSASRKDWIEVVDRNAQKPFSRDVDVSMAIVPWHLVEACARDSTTVWFDSIVSEAPSMRIVITELALARGTPNRIADTMPFMRDSALESLQRVVRDVHGSRYRDSPIGQWTWRNVSETRRRPLTFAVRELTAIRFPLFPHIHTDIKARINIAFILPIVAFGGVEKVAFAIATELRRRGWIPHLVISDVPGALLPRSVIEIFETISFLCVAPVWNPDYRYYGTSLPTLGNSERDYSRQRALGLLSGFDFVINAHCIELNSIMGDLKYRGVRTIAHTHVIDRTPAGGPAGHPYLALAFEHGYDAIICCSQTMRHWLAGMGIPVEKLVVVENAPSFPIARKDAESALDERAKRSFENPLRVLVLGRFDRQKGFQRVEAVYARLSEQRVPIDWRIVGANVIGSKSVFRLPQELFVPPALSPNEIVEHLKWADVLLVLSSWEGLPLTILEAMPFGVVPICTDVGAVREAVEAGINGVVVPIESAVQDAIAALTQLQADRPRLLQMATEASAAGLDRSWSKAVEPLVDKLRAMLCTGNNA